MRIVRHAKGRNRIEFDEGDREKIIELIHKTNANYSEIARYFSVRRETIRRVINQDPELKQIFYDVKEMVIDKVEGKLIEKALNGDYAAMTFYLKTQARHRGYVESPSTVVDKVLIVFDDILKGVNANRSADSGRTSSSSAGGVSLPEQV